MGVSRLSDGTPLTFEWLNSLADAINKLEALNKDDGSFDGLAGKEDIQVLTGSVSVNITGRDTKGSKVIVKNIKFKNPFSDSKVVVVAMVTSTAAKQNNKPIPAGVAVGEITQNNFDAAIQLFDDEGKFGKTSFELRYVAIGKRQVSL